jgi:hypothetical protein
VSPLAEKTVRRTTLNYFEARIDAKDHWAAYAESGGSASAVGDALADLLASVDVESASAAWDRIEEHVFSQGTIYSVAEPTVSVMLAARVDDQPSWRSGRIADLLFYILKGSSQEEPDLAARCLARAREGVWLLVRCALAAEGWGRDNLLEVLELVDPLRDELVRSVVGPD